MNDISCYYCVKHHTRFCPWGLYKADDDLCDDYESKIDAEYSYHETRQNLRDGK
jgi:hypothetical protein